MAARHVRLTLILGAFLAGLVLCGAVLLLVSGSVLTPNVPQVAAIGGPFRLINQDGSTVTDQDLKGRPFLVFFGFTHCPEVCPTTLFEISEVLRKLGPDADRVRAMFVTVDPERDTPKSLKDYLSSFDPRLSGLTGDPAAIAAVAKAYRVFTESAARAGRLHHGPHRDRLFDGQTGSLRRALQPQTRHRGVGRRAAQASLAGCVNDRKSYVILRAPNTDGCLVFGTELSMTSLPRRW